MRVSMVNRVPSNATRFSPRAFTAWRTSVSILISGNGEIAASCDAQMCGVAATMALNSAPPAAMLSMKPAR